MGNTGLSLLFKPFTGLPLRIDRLKRPNNRLHITERRSLDAKMLEPLTETNA